MFDWMRLKRTYIAFDKKINIYSFSSCIPFILSLAPIARKLILLITFYTLLQLCNIFNVACFCGWLSRIVFSCVVLSLRIVACLWDYSDFYVVADFHVSQSLLSLPHPFYSVLRHIRHKDITIIFFWCWIVVILTAYAVCWTTKWVSMPHTWNINSNGIYQ